MDQLRVSIQQVKTCQRVGEYVADTIPPVGAMINFDGHIYQIVYVVWNVSPKHDNGRFYGYRDVNIGVKG